MNKTIKPRSQKILVEIYHAAKSTPSGMGPVPVAWLKNHFARGLASSGWLNFLSRTGLIPLSWIQKRSESINKRFYEELADLEKNKCITINGLDGDGNVYLKEWGCAEAELTDRSQQRIQRLKLAIIAASVFLILILTYRWVTAGWPYIIHNPNENNQVSLTPVFYPPSTIALLNNEKDIARITGVDDPQFAQKILPAYLEDCPKALEPCSVFFDSGEGDRQEVHFTVKRNYPGIHPIIITGLRVKLIGFQPAAASPANMLILRNQETQKAIPVTDVPDEYISPSGEQTSEQQHELFFSLESVPGLNPGAQVPAGALTIGASQVLPPLCAGGAPDCSITLETGGSRDAVLILPRFATTPLGRYQLEISVLYSAQGNFEAVDRFRVEMYRPKNAQKWLWASGRLIDYSILTLENNQEYFAPDGAVMSDAGKDQYGRLILHAFDGMHFRDYIYDLHTGSLFSPNLVFTRDYISDTADQEALTSLRSPDGKKLAVHVQHSRSEDFDLDLAVIDYTDPYPALTVLTPNTPGVKDFWPAWSPSSTRLAFLKMTREATTGAYLTDLYVYNLKTKKETRITVSPYLQKVRPVWVGANQILVGFPDPGSSPNLDKPAGGYAIFDLPSGEMVWLPEKYSPQTVVRYLPGKDAVQIGRNLYDSRGNRIETLKIKNGCQLMPYASDYYACDTGEERKIYHYPNASNPVAVKSGPVNGPSVYYGSVPGGGFVTLDMTAGMLHQYNENGTWLRDWRAPVLTRLNPSTILTELVLIPE